MQFRVKNKSAEVAKPPKTQINAVFNSDSEEDTEEVNPVNKAPVSWFKPDAVLDDYTEPYKEKIALDSEDEEAVSTSSKRQKVAGLIIPKKTFNQKNDPRYIQALKNRSIRRELEMEMVQARSLRKTQKEDEEAFVTRAYKKHLEEREKFEKDLAEQDAQDALKNPKLRDDLTTFHHYMMISGLNTRTRYKEEDTQNIVPSKVEKIHSPSSSVSFKSESE